MKKSKICVKCEENVDEMHLLKCIECSKRYHIYCLDPPLNRLPRGDWTCPVCVQSIDSLPVKRKLIKKGFKLGLDSSSDEEEEDSSDESNEDEEDEEEEKKPQKRLKKKKKKSSPKESESEKDNDEEEEEESEPERRSKKRQISKRKKRRSTRKRKRRNESEDESEESEEEEEEDNDEHDDESANDSDQDSQKSKKKKKSSTRKRKKTSSRRRRKSSRSKSYNKRRKSLGSLGGSKKNEEGEEEEEEEGSQSNSESEEESGEDGDESYTSESGSYDSSDEEEDSDLDDLLCSNCNTGKDEDQILLCDRNGCNRGYHMYCLKVPLTSVPRGKWICDNCKISDQLKGSLPSHSMSGSSSSSGSTTSPESGSIASSPKIDGSNASSDQNDRKSPPTGSGLTKSPPLSSGSLKSKQDKEFKSLFIPKNTRNSLKQPAPVKQKSTNSPPLTTPLGNSASNISNVPVSKISASSSSDIKSKSSSLPPTNQSVPVTSPPNIIKDKLNSSKSNIPVNSSSSVIPLKKSTTIPQSSELKKSPPNGGVKSREDDGNSILDFIPMKSTGVQSSSSSISWDLSSSSSSLPIKKENSVSGGSNKSVQQMDIIENSNIKINPLKRSISQLDNNYLSNNNGLSSPPKSNGYMNNIKYKLAFENSVICNCVITKMNDYDPIKIENFSNLNNNQLLLEKITYKDLSMNIKDEIQKLLISNNLRTLSPPTSTNKSTSEQYQIVTIQPEISNDNSYYNFILKLRNNEWLGVVDSIDNTPNPLSPPTTLYIVPYKNINDFSLIGIIFKRSTKKIKFEENLNNNGFDNNINNICFLGYDSYPNKNLIVNLSDNGFTVLDYKQLSGKPKISYFSIKEDLKFSKKFYTDYPLIEYYKRHTNSSFIEGFDHFEQLLKNHSLSSKAPKSKVSTNLLFDQDSSIFVIDNNSIIESEDLFITQFLPLLSKLKTNVNQQNQSIFTISDSLFEELKPFSNQLNVKRKLLEIQTCLEKQSLFLCNDLLANQQPPKTIYDFLLFTLKISLSPQAFKFRNVILVTSNKIIQSEAKKYHSFFCLDISETIKFLQKSYVDRL